MNLLEEPWIPVRRASGARLWIAPHQVTEGIESDPIVALDAVRPDFNGALIQFLIGLVQTAWAHAAEDFDRDTLLWEPPAPEALKQRFQALRHAFELDGDGPRFMQDRSVATDPDRIEKLVSSQLVEAPGDKTCKDNTDHFVKRGIAERLCCHCTATALFTIQTNSPSGGRGTLVSLRGGGPLTTLIRLVPSAGLPKALWRDVASNVLPREIFMPAGMSYKDQPHSIFPWLGIPEKLSPTATLQPLDTHPAQVFWAMPRRLWLNFEQIEVGTCECCGRGPLGVVSKLYSRPKGLSYQGPWQHPFSPYYEKERNQWLCVHPQEGGIGYKYWLGAVLGGVLNDSPLRPAKVVDGYLQSTVLRGNFALWAFGYDMDNAKAKCWYEATFPLFDLNHLGESAREYLTQIVHCLLSGAERTAKHLRVAIRNAWVGDGELRGDLGFVESSFWNRTEQAFFDHVAQSVQLAKADSTGALDASAQLRKSWLAFLTRTVLRLFDELAASGDVESCHPERLGEAHRRLRNQLDGAKLHEAVGLRKPESGGHGKVQRRRRGRETSGQREVAT